MAQRSYVFYGSTKAFLEELCRDVAVHTGGEARCEGVIFITSKLTLSAPTEADLDRAEAYMQERARAAGHYFERAASRSA